MEKNVTKFSNVCVNSASFKIKVPLYLITNETYLTFKYFKIKRTFENEKYCCCFNSILILGAMI